MRIAWPTGSRFPALLLFATLSAVAACSSAPPDDTASYVASIARSRGEKDAAFKASASPIPFDKHAQYLPLGYFPVDATYAAPAGLQPLADDAVRAEAVLEMPTSTGEKRQMRRVGTLQFVLKGQSLKLTAFNEVGSTDTNHLFVPFTDLTTGTETYAAGRYLDLDRNATGVYIVDFNKAYFPYCYYNPTFDCPYPPSENRLKIPIRAGERLKTSAPAH